MNRVKIEMNASVPKFQVSAAGFDVETATPEQMLFDMGIPTRGYLGTFLRGAVSHTPNVVASEVTWTINFGKTFATPPPVFLQMVKDGKAFNTFRFFGFGSFSNAGPASQAIRTTYLGYTVSTTQLIIRRGINLLIGVYGVGSIGNGVAAAAVNESVFANPNNGTMLETINYAVFHS